MYLADYHTHCRVSPDSKASMVAQVEAAMAAGMHEICFTDHFEPFYWDDITDTRDPADWGALIAEFSTVQHQYVDKITVRLGIELGEAPMDIPTVEKMLEKAPNLDFIIGSIHRLSKAYDYVDWAEYRPKTVEEASRAIEDYLQVVQEQCNWGGFHVLGHLTLPLRYCKYLGLEVPFAPFHHQVVAIYKTLIDKGLGIELNTTRGDMDCPDEPWLKLYYDMGGRRITLGSDAHQPRDMGAGIRVGQALLKKIGFPYFSTFEQGKEIQHPL